jgi:hypothetical protein
LQLFRAFSWWYLGGGGTPAPTSGEAVEWNLRLRRSFHKSAVDKRENKVYMTGRWLLRIFTLAPDGARIVS